MSVEGPKRTIYMLTRNAAYCLGMMGVAMLACFGAIIILSTLAFWPGNEIMSVSSLRKVLQVASTPYKANTPILLVEDQGFLRFEQRSSENEEDFKNVEKTNEFLSGR